MEEELSSHCRLQHQNVIDVVGYVYFQEQIGFVEVFYPFGNLKNLLLDEKIVIAPLLQLQICTEMAKGVAFLHEIFDEKIIAHGNLKPENILINDSLQAKVGGMENTIFRSYNSILTFLDSKTPEEQIYVPPEFLKKSFVKSDWKKFDSYSVGMIMHMVLTRQKPCLSSTVAKCLETLKDGRHLDIHPITQEKYELNQKHRHDDAQTILFLENQMKTCWEEDSYTRPLVSDLKRHLQERLDKYDKSVLTLHAEDALKNVSKKKVPSSQSSKISLQQLLQKKGKCLKPCKIASIFLYC